MKKVWLLPLLFIVTSCGCGNNYSSIPAQSGRQIFERSVDACVIVEAKTSSELIKEEFRDKWLPIGSGFMIQEKKQNIVVTAAHVVEDDDVEWVYQIRLKDGTIVEVTEMFISKKSDVAFLKIKTNKKIKTLKLAKADPKVGEKIYLIGTPTVDVWKRITFEWVFAEGIVNQILKESVTSPGSVQGLDISGTHGNSGCTILNDRGEVAGLLTSGFLDWGYPQFIFGVPVSSIKTELKEYIK
jgi:S1-C subfamily serine protease